MKGQFNTIKQISEGLFKDRGSKFYAFAIPVESEDEIKEHLSALRKKYHDARHHCYAWKLGTDPGTTRANDDGEPSNSAGKPILNQIEKADLSNILVVVIRYFGGTLLGVSGLISAYRTATIEALDNNKIITEYVLHSIVVKFEYPLMNQVMKVIKDNTLKIHNQSFEMDCSLELRLKLDEKEKVISTLKKIQGCVVKTASE